MTKVGHMCEYIGGPLTGQRAWFIQSGIRELLEGGYYEVEMRHGAPAAYWHPRPTSNVALTAD